jgi:phosphocarrier protein
VESRTVVVCNSLGMHARAAARFARLAGTFRARVLVQRQSRVMDGKSIMGLLLLAASRGAVITVTAEGVDEAAAVDALCALVDSGFGEESWKG